MVYFTPHKASNTAKHHWLVVIASLGFCGPVVAAKLEIVATKEIAPGIVFQQQRDSSLPLIIDSVVVDLKNPSVRIGVALGTGTVSGGASGRGREDVTSMAQRLGAVAAINGDFFPYTGDPLGIGITGGTLFSEPWTGNGKGGPRATFSIDSTDRRALIAEVGYLGDLQFADGTRTFVDGIDRPAGKNDIIVCDSHYGESVTTKPGGTVAIIDETDPPIRPNKLVAGKVRSVFESDGTPVKIPHSCIALAASPGEKADLILKHVHVNEALSFVLAIADPDSLSSAVKIAQLPRDAGDIPSRSGLLVNRSAYYWATAKEALGGGPRLLHNGNVDIDSIAEGFDSSFADHEYPRTAVGTNADGSQIILVTVDGRQSLSRGATLAELAEILKKHGATEAMNLDGGGSTAMAIAGILVNNPEGAGAERPVADSLLVFSDNAWIAPLRDDHNVEGSDANSVTNPDTVMGDSELSQQDDSGIRDERNDRYSQSDTYVVPAETTVSGANVALMLKHGNTQIKGDDSNIIWQGSGGVGFVNQKGVLIPERTGLAHLKALFEGRVYTGTLHITGPDNGSSTVLSATLETTRPEFPRDQQLTVTCLTTDGLPVSGAKVSISVLMGVAKSIATQTNADGYSTFDIEWNDSAGGSVTVVSPGRKPVTLRQK